ncbi:hypothetical protein KKF05_05100 [Patescibacteria group bacterium]|nr:hypothetical protein [Patescibacteria group bacterium]MBU1028934.1 hypothetical protein [Patescibacteria group bacterium]MBU1915514.1 hypothetical protein [Patescibacteria group bacterium]
MMKDKTVRGLVLVGLLMLGLLVLGLLIGLVGSWLVSLSLPVTSAESALVPGQFVQELEEDLKTAARQVCIARQEVIRAPTELERVQRRTRLASAENDYVRIASSYNERLRIIPETQSIVPPDGREQAPTLNQLIEELRSSEGLNCPR